MGYRLTDQAKIYNTNTYIFLYIYNSKGGKVWLWRRLLKPQSFYGISIELGYQRAWERTAAVMKIEIKFRAGQLPAFILDPTLFVADKQTSSLLFEARTIDKFYKRINCIAIASREICKRGIWELNWLEKHDSESWNWRFIHIWCTEIFFKFSLKYFMSEKNPNWLR